MQQLTQADYRRAHDAFVARLQACQADILSVFLFGSAARGEVEPGYSDLDYWVFLHDDVLADFTRFRRVLDALADASRAVRAAGIPVYNVCCYAGAARLGRLPAMLFANLAGTDNGRIVLGAEVRPRMAPNPASVWINRRGSFLAMRQQLYLPLTAYLQRAALQERERQQIFQALQFAKYLPEAACAALDLWPGAHRARASLAAALPGLDLAVLTAVKQLCIAHGPNAALADLLPMLRQLLALVEAIHDALQARDAPDG